MKQGIHPDYKEITIVRPNGTTFVTRSTYSKGDRLQLDIDPTTHPAWTGGTAQLQQTGRVAKFNARFKGFGGGTTETPAAEEKTASKK